MVNEAHRVLVLEDHDFQRRVAVRLLKECGVPEVFEAASGGEALQLVRDRAMDVLLCDLQMPGMDGVEFIRHVAEEQLAHSIIIASGLEPALIGTVEEMATAHGLQVLGTIEKPLTKDKLQTLLRRYRPSAPSKPAAPIELMGAAEIGEAVRADQLRPYFQPKVAIATRQLVGVEALIHWEHPTRGLIPPAAFIPVAEDTTLMPKLTWIMLERSLAQCRVWADRGLRIPVSINFSPDVLSEVGVADHIAAMAADRGVEPALVVLEVTESMVVGKAPHTLEALVRLRMKGFGLSIDDYGTGYSSMQQLSRIPFTELKIDRSLVHGAADKPQLRTILQSSLELARSLGLTSVAEGVERQEDWNLLAELRCDVAQGYLISKPLPGDQIERWLEAWSSRAMRR
jgi:EAL domain-containing protein (putative c-di-GMP-specific phosphodiesterase class I)